MCIGFKRARLTRVSRVSCNARFLPNWLHPPHARHSLFHVSRTVVDKYAPNFATSTLGLSNLKVSTVVIVPPPTHPRRTRCQVEFAHFKLSLQRPTQSGVYWPTSFLLLKLPATWSETRRTCCEKSSRHYGRRGSCRCTMCLRTFHRHGSHFTRCSWRRSAARSLSSWLMSSILWKG